MDKNETNLTKGKLSKLSACLYLKIKYVTFRKSQKNLLTRSKMCAFYGENHLEHNNKTINHIK